VIDKLKELKPIVVFLNGLINEVEKLESELNDVRTLARDKVSEINSLNQTVNKLKKENYKLQLFIEEHVPEEKKKLIFK
jgi:predicted nuclease with TOPRIM domain